MAIDIPMDTNCALLVDLIVYSYKTLQYMLLLSCKQTTIASHLTINQIDHTTINS